jgi:5-dehydro-2-deoxygluconokinase
LWVGRPVELPGSRPLAFERGPGIGLTLRTFPAEHCVKCLVSYHPDDPEPLRLAQDRKLIQLYQACEACRLELLLEVIPPRESAADATTVARALERIYELGVHPDWWKLAPPDAAGWDAIEDVIARHDPHCRGVLLLGLEAPPEVLRRSFAAAAARRMCKGFAIGRSIFAGPARAWFRGEIDDRAAIDAVAAAYGEVIALWRAVRS